MIMMMIHIIVTPLQTVGYKEKWQSVSYNYPPSLVGKGTCENAEPYYWTYRA